MLSPNFGFQLLQDVSETEEYLNIHRTLSFVVITSPSIDAITNPKLLTSYRINKSSGLSDLIFGTYDFV